MKPLSKILSFYDKMVTVKFFAGLRDAVESPKIEVTADCVQTVLDKIVDKNQELKDRIFSDYEEKELKDNVILMVNGRGIQHLDGLDTELKERDTLSVFPTVAGG